MRPSPVHASAVLCSPLHGRRRKYASFPSPCQRGCRRFESGLVLQIPPVEDLREFPRGAFALLGARRVGRSPNARLAAPLRDGQA